VENIGDTKQAFAGIAEELRRQYWLGYYPTNSARDGRYRKIQVTTNIPNVAIRARDGYRAPSGEDRK
jgi:VWFA-related protein